MGIAVFCGFAIVAWILFRFAAPTTTYEDKRRENREAKLATIRQDEQAKLYSPAKYTDKAKGIVQIPIDTAMDLVANDYQAKPVAPSAVKVDNPYPAGLQTPAAAAVAASPAPNAPDVKKSSPAGAAASPAAATSPALPAPAMSVTTAPVAAPMSSPEVKP